MNLSPDFTGDADERILSPAEEARRQELSQAARRFWETGFRVIPLHYVSGEGRCSCGSPECQAQGKHPVDAQWQHPGEKDKDDAGWWRRVADSEMYPSDWRPKSNIGILTGRPSGIFVVDIDPDNGGDITWEQLQAAHMDEPLPDTMTTVTGSGGRHWFFRYPDFRVGNSKPWGAEAGIDIRGDGGQVVAPPSVSAKGPYKFLRQVSSAEAIAEAPGWILDRLRQHARVQGGEPVSGETSAIPAPVISAYVRSALAAETAKVRDAPEGNRNNTLNSSAFALGTLGAHGLISEGEARTALETAAQAAGLAFGASRATFTSGWRGGLRNPRDLSSVGELAGHEWHLYPWDEFGLGDRLVERHGETLRWVEETGKWMSYRNGTWHEHSDAEAERIAQHMIRRLIDEEENQYSDDEEDGEDGESPRRQFRAWVRKQRTAARVASTVRIARDSPMIRASTASFDEHPMLLNVANGIVDLSDGSLAPHDPSRMMTLQVPVAYDPSMLEDPLAHAPLWKAFLRRVQPDAEMLRFLQAAVGYSATADMGEQVMFLHYGGGANGKSVFHDAISGVLGAYAQATPVETLIARRGDSRVPNDVARMKGRRYLLASEARAGKALDWQVLKQLIGGDVMAARFLRQEFFEFRPVGKIHLTANEKPPMPPDDEAAWRRLHLVPWPVFIPPEERDGMLPAKLRSESQAILAWIIQGAVRWGSDRLRPPGHVEEAKEEYRQEEDVVEPLLGAVIGRVPAIEKGKRVAGHSCAEIFAAARMFWQMNGYEALTQRTLTERLMKKGFTKVQGTGNRGYFLDLSVLQLAPDAVS